MTVKPAYNCSGLKLRKARQFCGLTQRELSELSGLHINSIKRLERSGDIPGTSWYSIEKVISALETSGLDRQVAAALLKKQSATRPVPRYNFGTPRERAHARHGVLAEGSAETAGPPKRKQRCGAMTRTGKPCKRRALPNGRCPNHGGLSTGPRTKEGRRKIAAAQRKRWQQT